MGNSLDSYYLGDRDKVVWESATQAARQAYDQAGIKNTRKELDVAEVYNPFTFQEMLFYECFGFCELGESPDLVLKGTFTRKGELPCDPSGGVLCTNPIGNLMRKGTGGQLDFVIGAFWSKGGRAIKLIPSTTNNDTVSRIVPYIAQGARVTVPRHHTGYVVTEYGTADLYGLSEPERTVELIKIAHPKFREDLEKAGRERGLIKKKIF